MEQGQRGGAAKEGDFEPFLQRLIESGDYLVRRLARRGLVTICILWTPFSQDPTPRSGSCWDCFSKPITNCAWTLLSRRRRAATLPSRPLRGLAALEALLHVCNWERSPVSRTAHRCVLPQRAEQSDFWRRFSPTRFKWILVYRANPAVLSGKAVRQGSNNQGEGVGSKLLSAFTCRSICGLSG